MLFLITDTKRMIDDINRSSFWFGLWGAALNIPQVIGGFLFLPRLEAALILVTCAIPVVIAAQMHKRRPFTRLTSWVHLPWLLLLPYLVVTLLEEDLSTVFGVWLAYSTAVIAISLVLDLRNLLLLYFTDNGKFENSER